ncbi:MAG: mobile mystery protein B [Candidatus Chromulinivorax sp.]|nr:mobile mystery protein B [Candidatus Chromulinivorax sp.]
MKFKYPVGSTPIDSDELKGLIPKYISTQEELNAWESENILQAQLWTLKLRKPDVISIDFIKKLHKKMFDHTWSWAGTFRQSDKNIGVHWSQIEMQLKNLCDDVKFWIEHKTYFPDEIAIRFHYKLAAIHPFSNGNGRMARLITNLLIVQLGEKEFSWGSHQNLTNSTPVRKQYIQALQSADRDDCTKLLTFARS